MDSTVTYITSDSAAQTAISELQQFPKVCVDLETTGLCPRLSKPRLVQICDSSPAVEDRVVYVFDLFKIDSASTESLLELLSTREMWVGHNLYFDYQFFLSLGLQYKGKIFDTMIAERVLRAGFKEVKFSPKIQRKYFADIPNTLKAVAQRRLDIELDKEQQTSDWSVDELEKDQIEYAAGDVAILPAIAANQLQELRDEELLPVFSLESKIIGPVAKMSYTGFNVDVTKLKALEGQIQQELDKLTNVFCESLDERLPDNEKLPRTLDGAISVSKNAKKGFNPGSTAQVIRYFDIIGIDVPRNYASGKKTLSQIDLAEFASEDETLNHYRRRTK